MRWPRVVVLWLLTSGKLKRAKAVIVKRLNFFTRILLLLGFAAMPAQAVDIVSTEGDSEMLKSVVNDGKWSLVMLWAHDCVPCEHQKPMIERFHRRTNKRGVSVLGLSTDAKSLRSKAKETYQSTQTTFPNFFYEGNDFEQSFQKHLGQNFLGTPTYVVFSPDGQLTGVHTGTITREMLDKSFDPKLSPERAKPSVDLMQ